jgi:hypothetical protein
MALPFIHVDSQRRTGRQDDVQLEYDSEFHIWEGNWGANSMWPYGSETWAGSKAGLFRRPKIEGIGDTCAEGVDGENKVDRDKLFRADEKIFW